MSVVRVRVSCSARFTAPALIESTLERLRDAQLAVDPSSSFVLVYSTVVTEDGEATPNPLTSLSVTEGWVLEPHAGPFTETFKRQAAIVALGGTYVLAFQQGREAGPEQMVRAAVQRGHQPYLVTVRDGVTTEGWVGKDGLAAAFPPVVKAQARVVQPITFGSAYDPQTGDIRTGDLGEVVVPVGRKRRS